MKSKEIVIARKKNKKGEDKNRAGILKEMIKKLKNQNFL